MKGGVTITVDAPLGVPPLYVRSGSLLPLLPPGIDTLVPSSDPGTVSLDARAGEDAASAWVRGPASATCLDGSVISVTDDATGVVVTWSPQTTGRSMTMTLDLSLRTSGTTLLAEPAVLSGQGLAAEGSAASVASAPGGAFYTSGSQFTLRLVGPASARLAAGM